MTTMQARVHTCILGLCSGSDCTHISIREYTDGLISAGSWLKMELPCGIQYILRSGSAQNQTSDDVTYRSHLHDDDRGITARPRLRAESEQLEQQDAKHEHV